MDLKRILGTNSQKIREAKNYFYYTAEVCDDDRIIRLLRFVIGFYKQTNNLLACLTFRILWRTCLKLNSFFFLQKFKFDNDVCNFTEFSINENLRIKEKLHVCIFSTCQFKKQHWFYFKLSKSRKRYCNKYEKLSSIPFYYDKKKMALIRQ